MPTAILIPLNTLAIKVISIKLSKNMEIKKIITKEGTTIPNVATNAPITPAFLYPANVAQLIAIGPGVDSEIAIILVSSAAVNHEYFPTMAFKNGSVASPPPTANNPALKNSKNTTRYFIMRFFPPLLLKRFQGNNKWPQVESEKY